jgi:alginate O-acetyltransferase complex protein AlgI
MRAVAWAAVAAAVAGGAVLTGGEPDGNRMLMLCAALFLGMKLVVTAEGRLSGRPVPGVLGWTAFAFLWPGMRPWAFARAPGARARDGNGSVAAGLRSLGAGAASILVARWIGVEGAARLVSVPLALVGLGFLFHFGLFRVLAAFWRSRGAAVTPLFDRPLASRSPSEFWSRRWNLAFSEMLQVALRRPLRPALGPTAATGAAFLLSGLLHEAAISLPVRGGYGLPLLYFAIQAALVLAEGRLLRGRSAAIRRAGTLAGVVLPLPLVFHGPFLTGCVVPLLE